MSPSVCKTWCPETTSLSLLTVYSLVMLSLYRQRLTLKCYSWIRYGILGFRWTPSWARFEQLNCKTWKTHCHWLWAASHAIVAVLCPRKWHWWAMLNLYALSIAATSFLPWKDSHWYWISYLLPVSQYLPCGRSGQMTKGNLANDTQEQKWKKKWKKSTIWWKSLVEASGAQDPGVPTPGSETGRQQREGPWRGAGISSCPSSSKMPCKVQNLASAYKELLIQSKTGDTWLQRNDHLRK